MTAPESESMAVVLNPAAAAGRAERRWERIEAGLAARGLRPRVYRTEGPGDGARQAQAALADGRRRIVSAGGDGTHHEVVNGLIVDGKLAAPGAVFAAAALGTGSDLARSLGAPRAHHRAAAMLASARIIPVDVGRIDCVDDDGAPVTRHFINVASFGIGGEVACRVNRRSKRLGGWGSFFVAVLGALRRFESPEMHIETDGFEHRGRVIEAAAANGAYYGGGIHLTPEARLDSGRLELTVIHEISFWRALPRLWALYRGELGRLPHLAARVSARQIHISADRPIRVNADGELPGWLPATVTVLPGVLPICAAPDP